MSLSGTMTNFRDVADIHAAKPHRRARAQSFSIVEVGDQSDALREEAAGSGHQKQKHRQHQAGDNHRDADAKLRPFELLLTRQMISSDRHLRRSRRRTETAPRPASLRSIITKPEPTLKSVAAEGSAAAIGQADRPPTPHARVTVKPNWMAITMASTEPSTLAAAFIAQAHSTALSSLLAPLGTSSTGPAASARKPVGNGIPITKPSGANSRPLTGIRE